MTEFGHWQGVLCLWKNKFMRMNSERQRSFQQLYIHIRGAAERPLFLRGFSMRRRRYSRLFTKSISRNQNGPDSLFFRPRIPLHRPKDPPRELRHQIVRDGPIKYVEVLSDPCSVGTLRKHTLPHLNPPAQSDLGRRFLQPLGNRHDNGVAKDVWPTVSR